MVGYILYLYFFWNSNAFFSDNLDPNDIFINYIPKYDLKLYTRKRFEKVNHKIINVNIYIPLCKSNLQKAIRRSDIESALSSTLYLLQNAPMDLFRRLPIIEVEDVCILSSYNICIWLMMCNNKYDLSNVDYYNILLIVLNLCKIHNSIEIKHKKIKDISIDSLKSHNNYNILLGLFYRKEYGGMFGDLKMLNNVIHDLYNDKIEVYEVNKEFKVKLPTNFTILSESIDFHCYPSMVEYIEKNTNIEKDIIKKYIWNVESGLNFRKVETIENSKKYSSDDTWLIIKKYLYEYRSTLQ